MAIKSISQLDRFDNNTLNQGEFRPGDRLRFFDDNFLTQGDKTATVNQNWIGKQLTCYDNSYWSSLFEISKPVNYSSTYTQSDAATEYESQSLTYQNLMENIVWDVKAYLNARNNLSDFDFLSVITQDYTFEGNKWFTDNVNICGDLSVHENLTVDLDAYIGGELTVISDAYFYSNVDINKNLSVHENLTVDNTAKIENLSVNNTLCIDCNVSTSLSNLIFDGWAFGLIDRNNDCKAIFNPTCSGTWLQLEDDSIYKSVDHKDLFNDLSGMSERTGMPICFKDGRPYPLTCVTYALSAYNLIDQETGSAWNIGRGALVKWDKSMNDVNPGNLTSTYKAIYFENGKPKATNIIDFANHAKWSDLGERYLADKQYEPGTLIKFGGENEITIADTEVNAIVSTKAFDLNACLKNGTIIALCGRVPTKVKGKIEKFDKIMLSDTPGIACRWDGVSRVIGRALESNLDENVKLVECVTRFEI